MATRGYILIVTINYPRLRESRLWANGDETSAHDPLLGRDATTAKDAYGRSSPESFYGPIVAIPYPLSRHSAAPTFSIIYSRNNVISRISPSPPPLFFSFGSIESRLRWFMNNGPRLMLKQGARAFIKLSARAWQRFERLCGQKLQESTR